MIVWVIFALIGYVLLVLCLTTQTPNVDKPKPPMSEKEKIRLVARYPLDLGLVPPEERENFLKAIEEFDR